MFSFRRRITSDSNNTNGIIINDSDNDNDNTDADVLSPGDIVGQGLPLKGHILSLVANSQPAADSFHVIAHQGKGSYAVVYQAQEILPDRSLGRKFAIKCLSKRNLDEDAKAVQMAEVTIHQSLRLHPNIVTLYRTLQTPDYLLLLLEFVEGEDLFYFLEQSRDDDLPPPPPPPEDIFFSSSTPPTPSLLSTSHPSRLLSHTRLRLIASMFAQMCDAVADCHDQNVFHRDIKPENFIVTEELVAVPSSSLGAPSVPDRRVSVKLTDFGLSTREVECSDMDCGSAPYMSYECRNNIAPTYKPRAADVWSLGIVLINMLYHINPWTDTAHGACPSFETFRSTPTHSKFQFFMDRFQGMTKPVAEMLANRVFCILDDNNGGDDDDDSMRIEARDLGRWVRALPELLGGGGGGGSATTALVSSPAIGGMVPLSLERYQYQHHHRRSTTSPSSSSGCSSPALGSPPVAAALPSTIQGHRLSLSMRISHRPTSRSSRPTSVIYSPSASNRNSMLIGSPALGRLPLPTMPAPSSLGPALEREEEFGLGLSASSSKERLVDDDNKDDDDSHWNSSALSLVSSNGTVVPANGVGVEDEEEVEKGDAGGRESGPPSARRRKRGQRGKANNANAQAQSQSQATVQGQVMNSQGTQTPQSLVVSKSSSGRAKSKRGGGGGGGVPGSVNPAAAFVPGHVLWIGSDSGSGPGARPWVNNQGPGASATTTTTTAAAATAISTTSKASSSPLSVFASKFGGSGEKEKTGTASSGLSTSSTAAATPTAATMMTPAAPTSLSSKVSTSTKTAPSSSMSVRSSTSTKGSRSTKASSSSSRSSSMREPVSMYAVPSALLSKPMLPGGVVGLNQHHMSSGSKVDSVAAGKSASEVAATTTTTTSSSKNEVGSPPPVPVTKKPSKWKLSLRKGGAATAAAAAAAAATIEEAKVVPQSGAAATSETGSGTSVVSTATDSTTSGQTTTTTILASLSPPPVTPTGSLLRPSSSSTSLTPTTPGGSGSGSFHAANNSNQNQNAMSTTASNVTNLIMGLNPPLPHGYQQQQQQQHLGGGVDHMSMHSNRSTPSVGSGCPGQGKWRRKRRSQERDGSAIGFGTGAMGSFGTGTTTSSTTGSVRSFGTGGQRSAGSGTLYALSSSSSSPGPPLGLLPAGSGVIAATPRHNQQLQQQNPSLCHLQQERERMIIPTSLRGGGGAFNFGHNNGRHHTSFVHPSVSTALPFSGSSSSSSASTSWRNSMSTMSSTTTSTSIFSNSGTSSSTSAAASMSSPSGSTSAFTRYSNSSTRSVSTTATSVSDVSWRGGVGAGAGTNANANGNGNIPKNVKIMDGVPWELNQLPRGQYTNPVGDIFGSPPPTRKQRTRNKKAKQDAAAINGGNLNVGGGGGGCSSSSGIVVVGGGGSSSSAVAGSGPLDTINEKPMSGESGSGSGSVSVGVGVGNSTIRRDASTSTTDLVAAREEEAAATSSTGSMTTATTTTTTTTTSSGGTVKKVHKGQIKSLAKMLSALRLQ